MPSLTLQLLWMSFLIGKLAEGYTDKQIDDVDQQITNAQERGKEKLVEKGCYVGQALKFDGITCFYRRKS